MSLVQGIWFGMLCGTFVQTLVLLFIIWNTDWKAEVRICIAAKIMLQFLTCTE